MSLFLLDTNMASFAMKRHYPQVRTHLARAAKKHVIGVSAVTQGELIYGLHRKDSPNELVELIRGFLLRVEVLPWDAHVADTYGQVRAWCAKNGIVFSAMDLMIAAHAIHLRATLVTNDQTFHRLAFPRRDRKLPCQGDSGKGEFLASIRARYMAGGNPANASWGRSSL